MLERKDVLNIIDTKTLTSIYLECFKELISRKDYCTKKDLRMTYEVVKQKLIEMGDKNV